MRRTLAAALAAPLLLLSACSDDTPEVVETPTAADETTTDDAAETTEEPTTDDAAATTEAPTTTGDAAATTDEPTDDAVATTEGPSDEDDAGGAEGQAAAERTKEWLVAFVNGEDQVCDLMMDLSSEGPMKDKEADHEICLGIFPDMASELFDAEMAGIIESMEINGADVDGTTAVVDKDNFSPLFAEGMGANVITLQKVDDEWFVDMQESFNG
ncbi:hypothetical protein [Ornithinimicrobium cryptoxanthini]|uniref:hypothetical protein n=1 Tax=Ornithinimicrobium cryptoxanthini TaxID=2934161 RepID=UPI002118768E|nr:hypothetical protein [Ornithinimicrobium cryptoxanthini]